MKRAITSLIKDGIKGGLIGIAISLAMTLIGVGIPHGLGDWFVLIALGFLAGFVITVGNLVINMLIFRYLPRFGKLSFINVLVFFSVSTMLFYLCFSIFNPAMSVRERLIYSLGTGVASLMVGFFFVFSSEREERIRVEQENQRLLLVAERNRIAQELHDSVCQNFYGISLHLSSLEHASDLEVFHKTTRLLREMIADTRVEMGLLIHELRPAGMKQDFFVAMENLCQIFRTRYKLIIKTFFVGSEKELSDEIQMALYRITQEALNNVAKHAGARCVSISMELTNGHGILVIQDDGIGFERSTHGGQGLGLYGMEERANGIGGSLKILSGPGQGTNIELTF